MDVTSWLLRRTAPRVLLLTAPGGTEERLAVERVTRVRGWRMAMNPAEANTLVVAGDDHRFADHVRRVWDTVPAPRVLVHVATVAAEEVLAPVPGMLHDTARQRAEATRAATPTDPAPHGEHESHDDGHMDHAHMDHGGMGHDHRMADMPMPGDVPMADRAPDRDGLTLDQLRVPLGPALPLWPSGLIVHTRLQGDVIQQASVEVLPGGHGSFWSDHPVARRLDSCYRLLALTGWADAAATAQRLRDDALTGDVPDVRPWAARVRRSRTLRWLLSGVGVTPDGDALDRLHRWLDTTTDAPGHHKPQWTVDVMPSLLEGAELATARLIVASLDPDLDLLATHETHHG